VQAEGQRAPEIVPIDPMREGGIRLWHEVARKSGSDESRMVGDLLDALDRQRQIMQSLRTELSVHERRVRVGRISTLTGPEEEMLKFCIDAGSQVVSNAPESFSEADHKALTYLRETFGISA
jgi:hypothetical protein